MARKTGIWSTPTVCKAVAQSELSVAVTVSGDDKTAH